MQLGLIFGTFIGAILHSIFEAWWVAPGAAEFSYFWAVSGVAMGFAQTIRNPRTDAKVYRDQPLRV